MIWSFNFSKVFFQKFRYRDKMNILRKAMEKSLNKSIYCIRHGEAAHNVDFLKYGRSTYFDETKMDTSLTEKGNEQSKKLGETWEELKNPILVITSPLTRCLQTATNIFGTNVKIIALEGCREYPLGAEYCNKRKTKEELEKKFQHVDFSNITNEDLLWTNEMETHENFELRIKKFKEKIERMSNKRIVIVSHSTFLRKFIYDDFDQVFENELPHCTPIKYQNTY